MEEKTKIQLNKWQCGGGSIMVWGLLLPTGEIFVTKVTRKIKSDEYTKNFFGNTLSQVLGTFGDTFVLQQDNCSVYVLSKTL